MGVLAGPAAAKVTREILPNPEPSNLINISPIRIERTVNPGVPETEHVKLYNDSSDRVNLTLTVVDLGPPEDETTLAQPLDAGAYEFGAGEWLSPEITDTVLKPFEKLEFDVKIVAPGDAPVGSSFAGLDFEFESQKPVETSQSHVAVKLHSLLQILLTVPGPVKNDLELLSAKTRDAFHMGGTSFVTYGLRYENDGTVNDHVNGDITITSLFGNKVEKIPLHERILLRGAKGSDRKVWSDLPRFGLFRSTLHIKGDDGKVITKDLGRVYVLPPWWLIVLIIALIVVPPVYLWWRRRREWMLYMEDEEWDADGDEHAAY
jgi:hypothetical protein